MSKTEVSTSMNLPSTLEYCVNSPYSYLTISFLSFKQRFAEEAQISKEKEVELDKCLPQLQVAEEEFTDKNRKSQNLIETVTGRYEVLSN